MTTNIGNISGLRHALASINFYFVILKMYSKTQGYRNEMDTYEFIEVENKKIGIVILGCFDISLSILFYFYYLQKNS